jgi:hypothetical protein
MPEPSPGSRPKPGMGLALSKRRRNSTTKVILYKVIPWMAAGIVCAHAGSAHADGAFPNSQSVLLPRDRPREIVVGTTFGLIFTEDDGLTWRYTCESAAATRMGRQYVMGPPPEDRIYGLSEAGVPVTADGGCTWTVGRGVLSVTRQLPLDVFPDPSDPLRTFVLALDLEGGLVSAYRSLDGGVTYSGPIFTPPMDGVVTGIEVAASAPQRLFVSLYQPPSRPRLAESLDGGDHWTTTDIEPGIGAALPFLVGVDPTDSAKAILRITSGAGDPRQFQGLAITTDAGLTWSTPLKVFGGTLVGFARPAAETLLAIGTTPPAMAGGTPIQTLFRSDDGGQSFTMEPLPFHVVGLAARDGIVFAATDDFQDGFALASSNDRGRTWMPRLRFRDITGVKDCVSFSCQADCDYLAGVNLFPAEVCNPPTDAGSERGLDTGGGCSCGLAAIEDRVRQTTAGAALLLVGWLLVRRRARGTRF